MDIIFSQTPLEDSETLVMGVFADNHLCDATKKMDEVLDGALMRAIETNHFSGKKEQTLNIPLNNDYHRVVLLGLGE
ncbi:MAG: leucyl aminopeptidase, partial [Gammaproteobacteria bacterium]|nr:leucyl aminopeptidase [Gammaproteobacteria bacterium]